MFTYSNRDSMILEICLNSKNIDFFYNNGYHETIKELTKIQGISNKVIKEHFCHNVIYLF